MGLMEFNWHDNKRFFVKIIMGQNRNQAQAVYYRTDLRFPLFNKWNCFQRFISYKVKNNCTGTNF